MELDFESREINHLFTVLVFHLMAFYFLLNCELCFNKFPATFPLNPNVNNKNCFYYF